jgi:hypothetical protein
MAREIGAFRYREWCLVWVLLTDPTVPVVRPGLLAAGTAPPGTVAPGTRVVNGLC